MREMWCKLPYKSSDSPQNTALAQSGYFLVAPIDNRANYASFIVQSCAFDTNGAPSPLEQGSEAFCGTVMHSGSIRVSPRLDAVRLGEWETSDGKRASFLTLRYL